MIQYLKKLKKKITYQFLSEKEKRHLLVGPSRLWKMKQEFQIKFLKSQGLAPQHLLLDVGCGTLRGGIPIIQYLETGNYYGIDVRKEVIEEGKKELKEEGLENKHPNLIAFSDFSTLTIDKKLDVMFAFSVLIHLEDSIAEKCFTFVSKSLKPNGRFFANVNVESYTDGKWQGFPVVFRSLDFYKNLATQNNLSMKIVGELKDLGHISGQELADKQVMLVFTPIV